MLLAAEHLTKYHDTKRIVEDVSFVIEERDKLALIGANGCGKSTLLSIVAGKEPYENGQIIRRSKLRIAYLPQEPLFQEEQTVLWQILSMDPDIKEFEARSILGKLGIDTPQACIAHLSGGQRKRVALARALLQPCDLLLLDEPTNHLDHTMIDWLEHYLIRFSRALLMVTHDRYFMERVCGRILEIDRGKLYTYEANYSLYLEQKAERQRIALAQDKKRAKLLKKELAWMRAGVQARGTKSKDRIDRFYELAQTERYQGTQTAQFDTMAARLGKKTIEWEQLAKAYGDKVLFQHASYHLGRRDRIGILGPNGCGKSTLLRILAKEEMADRGSVVYGETVRIGFFKQGCEDMDATLRVIDYIQKTSDAIETPDGCFSAAQMLERFLFDRDMQYTLIGRLSGGERRRLYLLKVLMEAPNILLLDEPTNDLDIETLQVLEDYLDSFPGAVLVVSHDRYFLDRICQQMFVFMPDGTIAQQIGGYSAVMQLQAFTKVKKEKPAETARSSQIPKLTTKEKQELAQMDARMDDVQQQIAALDEQMEACAADFQKLQQLSDERLRLESRLEEMLLRWEELSMKQQQIEAMKEKRGEK